MKKTLWLFTFLSLVLISACSSKEAKDQSIHVLPPEETKAAAPPPIENLKIISYYKQIHPNLAIEFQEAKEDYLKTKSDNPVIFSLFKGPQADLLIEQTTTCYKLCQQQFKAYTFKNGRLDQPVRFDSFYPKQKMDQHLNNFKKKISQRTGSQSLQPWLYLPKEGSTISALIVDPTTVYDAGSLNWTGSRFEFQAYNSDMPSKTKVQDLR